MTKPSNTSARPHATILSCALAVLALHGCGDDALRKLTCTGIDTGASVVGSVRTERHDASRLSFDAERLNAGITGLFQDPVFRIVVNGFEFDPARVVATPDAISGKKAKGEGNEKDLEASFSFDRRSRTLKYHLSADSVEAESRQPRNDTMEFEGTCNRDS